MNHRLPALFGLLTAVFLASGSIGAEPIEPTWFAQAMAYGEGGLNVTNFWSRGAKMRAETIVAGHRIVTIVSGEYYYAYDSLEGRGLAIRRDPKAIAEDHPYRRPFGREHEKLLAQGAEVVRREIVMGRPCDVLRVTDRLGRREVWITVDTPQLPVRLQIYRRHTAVTQTTDYLNWQSSLRMPKAFFEPEQGMNLERMDLETYLMRTSKQGPQGPVPVLYADLLHGPR